METSSKDEDFKKLFKTLLKQNATGIIILSKWLIYLKTHPYNADLNFFKEG